MPALLREVVDHLPVLALDVARRIELLERLLLQGKSLRDRLEGIARSILRGELGDDALPLGADGVGLVGEAGRVAAVVAVPTSAGNGDSQQAHDDTKIPHRAREDSRSASFVGTLLTARP
jgi:hypothetical protein